MIRKISMLSALAVLLVPALVFAASGSGEKAMDEIAEYHEKRDDLVPLRTILQYGVYTESADEVGEIEDIILDPETGLTAFAAVENGGELKAAPMNLMRMDPKARSMIIPDDAFAADVSAEYVSGDRGTYSYAAAKEVYQAHDMRDYIGVMRDIRKKEPGYEPSAAEAGLIEAELLYHARVADRQGAPLGYLDSMLLDPNTNMVTVMLVRIPGENLSKETLKPLPWKAVDLETEGYKLYFTVTSPEIFEMTPVFDREANFSLNAAQNLYRQYKFRYYQRDVTIGDQ
jgi:sporulation protein YlmC with PRC-barrel domain